MSFDVSAEKYQRFMGVYSEQLAEAFAGAAGLVPGDRVLDVGCGPGALTGVLVDRLGAAAVAAVDPSEPFVAAARERFPEVDVRRGTAEPLGYDDAVFDAALASLVVNFMTDPVAGLREMARVTRPGGTVAACLWDFAGRTGPLSLFWSAACDLDGTVAEEVDTAGAGGADLVALFTAAGLTGASTEKLTVTVGYDTVEQWWEPYTLGVGPAGAHVQGLGPGQREALRARCAELLPAAPFTVAASAWCVVAQR